MHSVQNAIRYAILVTSGIFLATLNSQLSTQSRGILGSRVSNAPRISRDRAVLLVRIKRDQAVELDFQCQQSSPQQLPRRCADLGYSPIQGRKRLFWLSVKRPPLAQHQPQTRYTTQRIYSAVTKSNQSAESCKFSISLRDSYKQPSRYSITYGYAISQTSLNRALTCPTAFQPSRSAVNAFAN